jgi:glucose-6-phosphate 1-dehydrogenase
VPFFVRAAKALACRATEVRTFYRRLPRLAFVPVRPRREPDQVILRVDPLKAALRGQAYRAGLFGPPAAEAVLRGYPVWRPPWLPA